MLATSQVFVPLAHMAFDHWYGILVYLAPVAIVIASIVGSTLRQRREDDSAAPPASGPGAGEPPR